MRHVARTTIRNRNPYPISIQITTANISQTYGPIQADETYKGEYDWTHINKIDGSWNVVVTNLSTEQKDSFSHGYFSNGILSNYIDIECKADQLKIVVSD
jgi:hypothetical protein